MAVLKENYQREGVANLMKRFSYQSVMQVPRLEKIVLNVGLGEAIQNANAIESATSDLMAIAGQRPIVTKAKKSIAAFRLREGMSIGLKVTLRQQRMYDFLERLINVVLPRMREFQGVPVTSFDGRGNYTMALKEQVIFPEISYEKAEHARGLEITIVTSARNDEEGQALLEELGMPFARD